jgi:hypothetical protein
MMRQPVKWSDRTECATGLAHPEMILCDDSGPPLLPQRLGVGARCKQQRKERRYIFGAGDLGTGTTPFVLEMPIHIVPASTRQVVHVRENCQQLYFRITVLLVQAAERSDKR